MLFRSVSTTKETSSKTEETTTVENGAEPSVTKTSKQLEEKRKDEAKPDYEGKIDNNFQLKIFDAPFFVLILHPNCTNLLRCYA